MKALLATLASCLIATNIFAVQEISPKDAADLVRQGKAELIDVRESSEIETTGKATPAKWLATSQIKAQSPVYKKFVQATGKEKKLIFYCKAGARSAAAATQFEKLGFTTFNMGGFDDWKNAGLPTLAKPNNPSSSAAKEH